jgi:hypothetical protein
MNTIISSLGNTTAFYLCKSEYFKFFCVFKKLYQVNNCGTLKRDANVIIISFFAPRGQVMTAIFSLAQTGVQCELEAIGMMNYCPAVIKCIFYLSMNSPSKCTYFLYVVAAALQTH